MKAFFEDPALLVGWPLLVVGMTGAFLAFSAFVASWANPQ
jgi:uncharacterized iron-regulated membrane protein